MKNILKLNKLFIGILILTLNSCHLIGKGNGIEFTIESKSDFPIENVRFTTPENLAELKFDKIDPNGTVSDFHNMKDNKSDGNYVLEFTLNGKKETHSYGYYTNGGGSLFEIICNGDKQTGIKIINQGRI
jgi:hypothetical protein